MSITQGKALLVITRTHEKDDASWQERSWDVNAFIQKCEGDWAARDWAYQCLNELLDYEALPVPRATKHLKFGDTLRVYVVFRIRYRKGSWGYDDDDVELEYLKERVRKIQRYRPRYYQGKMQ